MRTSTSSDQSRDEYALNSAEVDVLLDLVGEHYDRPAIWASNLLCAGYGKCRAPYTGGAGKNKSGHSRQRASEPISVANSTFAVYPNPSRDQVVLRYDFGAQATQLRAELRDAVGRIVASIPLDGARGQTVFDTTPFAPGTYLVQYLGANGLAGTVPLVIQR